ncbi:MAG: RNA-guided endonuclease InsQ/TnpB family protein, partial [Xenococcaceae cyanobacterium]
KQLLIIKNDLILVDWSKELLDFSSVPSQTLQKVCKRAELAFDRYVSGDTKGKRSGKPRFKNTAQFRAMVFEGAKLHSDSINKEYLYVSLPKLKLIKIRHHRSLPNGFVLKQVQLIKKADGWYINLKLEDNSIPEVKPDIIPTWNNSIGMDAVLYENDYLATSEGTKLPSRSAFRESQNQLAKISKRKSTKKKGSKIRRKLAKKESKIHQHIARARKDHAYKTAEKLLKAGKKVFFHEKLNLNNIKRVGLDLFPTIKRRKKNLVVTESTTPRQGFSEVTEAGKSEVSVLFAYPPFRFDAPY